MQDPRIDKLANVLIHHSCRLKAGQKVLIEAFDLPEPNLVCRLVDEACRIGAIPIVNIKNNAVLRSLYRGATEDSMKLAGEFEAAVMSEMDAYIGVRRTRFGVLIRQYVGSLGWQAIAHGGLIATAGWLLGIGQLTLGQFVAAEVVVSGMLSSFDGVVKRMGHIYYFLTALTELNFFFSLPKDQDTATLSIPLPDPTVHGIRVTCKDLTFAPADGPPVFERFNLEVIPREKISVLSGTSRSKTSLALILAGLYHPTSGVIRYNDVDLRDVSLNYVNRYRGVMLDSHPTLFDGSLEENMTLQRPSIRFEDLSWALRFVELEEEIDAMPMGLETLVHGNGANLTRSQVLRILLARMIVTRPELLIFNGSLHNIEPGLRLTLLRRLCSKEEPWSVVFVSNDPEVSQLVERRVLLD